MNGITKSDLRSYSLLAFPLAVAGLPLYLHAPDFYVTERNINLAFIGFVLLSVRILDAVQDPLIGYFSDKYRQKRLGIMTWAMAGLGIGMICLFTPPDTMATAWFAFWVVVCTTCFSILSINLNTIGGIWSDNSHQRTVIASSRERFGLFGILLGVMIPGILILKYSKTFSFGIFSILLACVLIACGWKFRTWAKRFPNLFNSEKVDGGEPSSWKFKLDPASWRLVLLAVPSSIASALPAVLFLFFVRDVIAAENMVWIFLLVYFLSAVAGVPVWRNLSARMGKVRTWSISIAMAILSFIAAAFVTEGMIPLYIGVCFFTGFALGGDLIFPASLMADIVGKNEYNRGKASIGYAWLSFVQKAGLGLAAGIAFPVLAYVGFSTGETNSSAALGGLTILYAILPILLKGTSLWMLWMWRDYLEGSSTYEKKIDNNLCRTATTGPDNQWM